MPRLQYVNLKKAKIRYSEEGKVGWKSLVTVKRNKKKIIGWLMHSQTLPHSCNGLFLMSASDVPLCGESDFCSSSCR